MIPEAKAIGRRWFGNVYGGETRGYGSLDDNGFWEYQIPDVIFQRFGRLQARIKALEAEIHDYWAVPEDER
jgi:hypothetical protein